MKADSNGLETKHIGLVGAAACIGAPDHRCELGPERVWGRLQQQSWFNKTIQEQLYLAATVRVDPQLTDAPVIEQIAEFSERLAGDVKKVLLAGNFPIVIGGDHSCAIGSWSGVAAALQDRGDLGLIWVDAHMDSHVPESSPSGAIHGMPVACLLGHGDRSLTGVALPGPKVKPENLCLVGVRSYEAAERELLERLGVTVLTMDEVNRLGIEAALARAHAVVTANTTAYGVSIDLDGIDPVEAPGVGSPVVGGVSAAALLAQLARWRSDPAFRVLEIAELNPVNDVGSRTTDLVLEMIRVVGGWREL